MSETETTGEVRARGVRSRMPWGGIGMLGLIVVVELLISRASLDLLRPEFWLWYASDRSSRQSAATAAEVLCLGTSQTSYGVVPQVLQERLGRPVYSLAMCSSPPQADYYLLKRVLDAGGRPKAVVLDLHPHLMSVSYWGSIRFFPNLLSAGESLDLAWTAGDPDFATQVLLTQALPSVLGRFDIRNAIRATLEGKLFSVRKPTLSHLWNREENQGAIVLPPRDKPLSELTASDYEWYAPPEWRLNPINTLYVRRLLRLAAAHRITVYLLIPPIDARLEQIREQRGLAAAYREFAGRLQARHFNLVVVEATPSSYPPGVFHDGMHLSHAGAVAMTSDLAEILRPRLDAPRTVEPRWLALLPYRDRRSAAPIAELGETGHVELPVTMRR